MKKLSTSFRLSEEAKDILKTKAKEFHISQTAILESIIREFSPSTKEEKAKQKKQRMEALKKYTESWKIGATLKDAWRAGFKIGWVQFQTRKATSLFNKK